MSENGTGSRPDSPVVSEDDLLEPRLWPSASDPDPLADASSPAGSEPASRVHAHAEDGSASDTRSHRARRTTTGRRTKQRRSRRRRSLFGTTGYVLVTLVVAALLVVAFERFSGGGDGEPDPSETLAAEPQQDAQRALVFVTFDEADPRGDAQLITIVAHDRVTDEASILFVPTTMVADVPGHGLLPIGRAFAFGKGPLLDATLDNLLGIDLDHVVAVSQQGWSSLFTRVGGLSVDLPERLVAGSGEGGSTVRFQPGEQFLDGPRLAELLTFVQPDETQLGQLPRAQLVITALLDALQEEPSRLDAVFQDGAPMLDTVADADDVRSLFEALAAASVESELVVRTLPVTPIGSGEEDSYRPDTERIERIIDERFSGSVPVGSEDVGRSLQILNGHGAPGIGGEVAQQLLPHGFRVVLTGNADTFDHDETRVLVYDDSPEQLAIAQEIVEILGVGRVERSLAPQSVVDITIVVGRDFTAGR